MPGPAFGTPPGGTGAPAPAPAPAPGAAASGTAPAGGFGAPGSGSAVPGAARPGDGFGAFPPASGVTGGPGAPGPARPSAYGPGAPGPVAPGAEASVSAAPGSGIPGPGTAGGAAFGTGPGGAGGSDTVRIIPGAPGTGTPGTGNPGTGAPDTPDTVRITPGPPPGPAAPGPAAPGPAAPASPAAGLPAAEPAAAEPASAAGPFGGFGPPPADTTASAAAPDALERGKRTRRDVLGDEHAARAEADRDAFTADFHDLVTRSAWGDAWARPGLDHRTRALLTLTALTARGHYDDIAPYTRAALRSGAGPDEIKETLLHAAVYCGLPAAGAAFAVAQRVIAEEAGPRP
ncbi:carboxymuconolactone decarboxylase family protein [Streptomyces abikoensis]